jgi:murein DD-endopeptidase MepM/ murein hydrolase activator NlpD
MRKGVCVLICGLAVFAAAAQASADDNGTGATSTGATTTEPTTSTTTVTTTPAAPTTSTARPTTTQTTSPQASFAPAALTTLPHCASAGAAAIVLPGRTPLAVGAVPARLGASAYPASGTVLTFGEADAFGTSCRPGAVSVRSVSLFDGAVTAASVSARNGVGSASGVTVQGNPVSLGPGASMALGGWGLLTTSARVGDRLRAPLSLELLEPRGGLPSGTVVLIGYGASTPAAAHKEAAATPKLTPAPRRNEQTEPATPFGPAKQGKHKHIPQPLKVTPPLGLSHYDFPVAGGADYGDTYGGPRGDIYDGWHHGDDLFAPLGTPVVAVADGTLSLVGYERLGGWRLWLQDSAGNQFYYAHLSAYSLAALKGGTVKAGQVLGFLGRTGDAFTTTPHLHFEVHPHQLLSLGYDGAVDPTTYLHAWSVVHIKHVPRPWHKKFPAGERGVEAEAVWRQLLASGLVPLRNHALTFAAAPLLRRSDVLPSVGLPTERVAAAAASPVAPGAGGSMPRYAWALLVVAVTIAASFSAVEGAERLLARRRTASKAAPQELPAPSTTEP